MVDFVSIGILTACAITSISGSISFCYIIKKKSNNSPPQYVLNTISTTRIQHSKRDSDIVTYRLMPDELRPDKIINVYNLTLGRLQYRFIKPMNYINNEINLYWHQEFILQDLINKLNIASIFCASIGKGSYIEFLKNEQLDGLEDIRAIYQLILKKLKFKRIEEQTQTINKIYRKELRINEKIYISSKLRNDLHEFKLCGINERNEQSKYLYRWSSSTGHLKKVNKFSSNNDFPIALIKNNQGSSDYIIEIDRSIIDVDIVLCTSLIFNSNK